VNPIAVVTGAAAGIGRAVAERLGADGYSLVLVDLVDELDQTAVELSRQGLNVMAVQIDLTQPAGREVVRAAVDDLEGSLRALVNNAGITRDARLVKMTGEEFQAVVEVNLGAAYLLTLELLPTMTEGGSIVNMSSRSYLGNFGQFNYSLSKGGLVGMTRALALGLAPRIRVNAVAPGLVATEMTMKIPEDVRGKLVSAVPMGRMAEPQEVADLVAFLVSDQSSYITGGVHIIGGGRSLR
jgi:NAD(P)-dependent dehydrogenase (short-subunit alcohol dehydrogenase family)